MSAAVNKFKDLNKSTKLWNFTFIHYSDLVQIVQISDAFRSGNKNTIEMSLESI